MRNILFACVCCLVAASCGVNEQQATSAKKPASLSAKDQQLVKSTYLHALLNVKLAEEGLTRSTTYECRSLAQKVLSENKNTLLQLTRVAGKHAVELPLDITDEQLSQWHQLVREYGISFDKKFAATIQEQQQAATTIMEQIEDRAADADVRKVATSYRQLAGEQQLAAENLLQYLMDRRSRDTLTTENPIARQVSNQQ